MTEHEKLAREASGRDEPYDSYQRRLPILADAIQDAGCEDAEVLAYCRSDGPQVRGYQVVDGG